MDYQKIFDLKLEQNQIRLIQKHSLSLLCVVVWKNVEL